MSVGRMQRLFTRSSSNPIHPITSFWNDDGCLGHRDLQICDLVRDLKLFPYCPAPRIITQSQNQAFCPPHSSTHLPPGRGQRVWPLARNLPLKIDSKKLVLHLVGLYKIDSLAPVLSNLNTLLPFVFTPPVIGPRSSLLRSSFTPVPIPPLSWMIEGPPYTFPQLLDFYHRDSVSGGLGGVMIPRSIPELLVPRPCNRASSGTPSGGHLTGPTVDTVAPGGRPQRGVPVLPKPSS